MAQSTMAELWEKKTRINADYFLLEILKFLYPDIAGDDDLGKNIGTKLFFYTGTKLFFYDYLSDYPNIIIKLRGIATTTEKSITIEKVIE